MRRFFEIAAGLGLCWIALQAAARVSAAEPAPPSPPAAAAVEDPPLRDHPDPVVDYTLQASLDTNTHVVKAQGTIHWRNVSRVPQREIWLHLYLNAFKNERTVFHRFEAGDFRGTDAFGTPGYITIKRLSLGGRDLWAGADKTSPGDPEDETDIRVPLPDAVAPGDAVDIDVAFESHLPVVGFRTGYFGAYHFVGQWFPKLAKLEPDGRWAHFTFHRLSEFYADFGSYDVTIDTPANVVVGATGALQSEAKEGDRIKRRFVQRDVHDFAFSAWDDFRELSAVTEDGVAVRVLYPPKFDAAAQKELSVVRFGLRHFNEAYGRYPYKTLTVVHPPPGAEESGGMEYPTLITTGGFWFGPYVGDHFLDLVTIHELGHQWFYGLVATDEHVWPFLDEGLNSYAEVEAMEALHPKASGFHGLGIDLSVDSFNALVSIDNYRNARVAQPAASFASGGDYGSLIYSRTATILRTLGNVYGEDAMRRAIGLYTRRHRFAHPGPADFEQAVREVVGADAADQLHAALFDRASVDYVVSSLQSEKDGAAEGVFGDPAAPAAAPVTGSEGFHGSVLVRRRGDLRFPVDVDLIAADGTVDRVRWDAAEPWARLPWHGKSRLVGAVIDPDHRVLLDEDFSNNARNRKAKNLSFTLVDRISFAASALLSGVLP